MSACPPMSTDRGHVRPLSAPIGRTNGQDGRIQTEQMAVKFSIAVDVTDDDGQVHRIGLSHRHKWECFKPGCSGRRCTYIDAAREAAGKEIKL